MILSRLNISVVVQIPVVQILGEWCRHVSILPPTTLHVALVVGVGMVVVMAAFVPLVGFPNFESETIRTTNKQISASLVSLSVPHSVALAELLLTTTPVEKLALVYGNYKLGPFLGHTVKLGTHKSYFKKIWLLH